MEEEKNTNLNEEKSARDISEYMTPAELQKHLGVNSKTMWRAEKTGKIQSTMIDSRKMFHVGTTLKSWVANTKMITAQNKDLMERMSKEVKHKEQIKENEKPPLDSAYPELPDYSDSKKKTEHFTAKTKELEFKKRSGELVLKKDVEKNYFEFSRKLRDDILGLPSRLSSDLALESDPQKVELFLTKELNKFLEGLANA